MDRKGIIAVGIAIVTLFAWTFINQREMEKAAVARRAAAAEKAASAPAAAPSPAATPPIPAAPVATSPTEPLAEEKSATLTNEKVDYTFSNLGGGIARAHLRTHEAEGGKPMTINEFGTTLIGAVSEIAGEGIRADYAMQRDEVAGTVAFERTDSRGLQLSKKFAIAKPGDGNDEYSTRLELVFTNRGTQPIAIPSYFVHTGAAAPIHQRDLAMYTGVKADGEKFIDVNWFSAGGFLAWSHPERPVFTKSRPDIGWLGVTNQYFSTLVSPGRHREGFSHTAQAARGIGVGETLRRD
jgi:YidC/Oxa1 family membrane protein insertase